MALVGRSIIAQTIAWMVMMMAITPASLSSAADDFADGTVTIADLSQDFPEDAAAMASSPGSMAIHDIASNDPLIRAAVVLEKGIVVAKYIREDVDAETPFQVWSTTKSWISLLIGILVDHNLLSINETLGDIFANDSSAWDDVTEIETIAFRKAVTIEEMLTMSSGLVLPPNEYDELITVKETVEEVLKNGGGSSLSDTLAYPFIGDKGVFSYLAMSNILSYVVKERAGMTPRKYLAENVMVHLSIAESEYSWLQNSDGVEFSFHGLELTPLQMAKFGQLYLQGGQSGPTINNEEHRVISQSWIDASFTQHSVDSEGSGFGYGYLFWDYDPAYCALGLFGQDICIDRHLERVVVQQRDPNYDNALQGTFGIPHVALKETLSFDDVSGTFSMPFAPLKVAKSLPTGPKMSAVALLLLSWSVLKCSSALYGRYKRTRYDAI